MYIYTVLCDWLCKGRKKCRRSISIQRPWRFASDSLPRRIAEENERGRKKKKIAGSVGHQSGSRASLHLSLENCPAIIKMCPKDLTSRNSLDGDDDDSE